MINRSVNKEGCIYNHNGCEVVYDIKYSMRRSIGIAVSHKSKKVTVTLPVGYNEKRAHNIIIEKIEWILASFKKLEQRTENHIPRRYENGAEHLFLGEKYIMEIIIASEYNVELRGNKMIVFVKDPTQTEAVVKWWQTKVSGKIFADIAAPYINKFGEVTGLYPKNFDRKFVKGYWGVCRSNGEICFNIDLIRAPKECIEYIVVHELCHLLIRDHSKQFYEIVALFMPDWKERNKLLNKTISCRS